MNIPSYLLDGFAKTTRQNLQKQKELSVFGTVTNVGTKGLADVIFDGSDILTRCKLATEVKNGDRVIVTLKNRKPIVTSNVSNTSAIADLEARVAAIADLEARVAAIEERLGPVQPT